LIGVRKRSWAIAKMIQMIASVIRTRSDPASPSASLRSTTRGCSGDSGLASGEGDGDGDEEAWSGMVALMP
jgi:hypothetical protein